MDQKLLKAQVKGKIKNLTANYGPNFLEGPSKRNIRKLDCQLWTNNFFEGPSKREIQKFNCQLWTNNFFEGPSKREIQKLNCQLWTKKMEAQVKGFFCTFFFHKNRISNQGFKKKLSVLSPEFYFTSWIFVKKNGTKAAVSRPYQGRIRAVPGPYQAQNLKFHIFSFCFIHDGFHFWF